MLGSLCNPSPAVQEQAIAHMVECCEIMAATGSAILSVWLADGTNYAGQDSVIERKTAPGKWSARDVQDICPKARAC